MAIIRVVVKARRFKIRRRSHVYDLVSCTLTSFYDVYIFLKINLTCLIAVNTI